jgi:hypothetical protein
MADDLWPENIAESTLVTPISIMKEQAALLGEKTKQLVKGEVTSQSPSSIGGLATPFVHRFYIVAPTLNYRYELFSISHGINFYPLSLSYANTSHSMRSEAEFKENLKTLLSSQHTLNVVHSILAQVRA